MAFDDRLFDVPDGQPAHSRLVIAAGWIVVFLVASVNLVTRENVPLAVDASAGVVLLVAGTAIGLSLLRESRRRAAVGSLQLRAHALLDDLENGDVEGIPLTRDDAGTLRQMLTQGFGPGAVDFVLVSEEHDRAWLHPLSSDLLQELSRQAAIRQQERLAVLLRETAEDRQQIEGARRLGFRLALDAAERLRELGEPQKCELLRARIFGVDPRV